MTGQEIGSIGISLGPIGISILLVIILNMIFGTFKIPNKFKSWIAVFIGMVLAVVALIAIADRTVDQIIDYLVKGFLAGASATGIYEMGKKHQ